MANVAKISPYTDEADGRLMGRAALGESPGQVSLCYPWLDGDGRLRFRAALAGTGQIVEGFPYLDQAGRLMARTWRPSAPTVDCVTVQWPIWLYHENLACDYGWTNGEGFARRYRATLDSGESFLLENMGESSGYWSYDYQDTPPCAPYFYYFAHWWGQTIMGVGYWLHAQLAGYVGEFLGSKCSNAPGLRWIWQPSTVRPPDRPFKDACSGGPLAPPYSDWLRNNFFSHPASRFIRGDWGSADGFPVEGSGTLKAIEALGAVGDCNYRSDTSPLKVTISGISDGYLTVNGYRGQTQFSVLNGQHLLPYTYWPPKSGVYPHYQHFSSPVDVHALLPDVPVPRDGTGIFASIRIAPAISGSVFRVRLLWYPGMGSPPETAGLAESTQQAGTGKWFGRPEQDPGTGSYSALDSGGFENAESESCFDGASVTVVWA